MLELNPTLCRVWLLFDAQGLWHAEIAGPFAESQILCRASRRRSTGCIKLPGCSTKCCNQSCGSEIWQESLPCTTCWQPQTPSPAVLILADVSSPLHLISSGQVHRAPQPNPHSRGTKCSLENRGCGLDPHIHYMKKRNPACAATLLSQEPRCPAADHLCQSALHCNAPSPGLKVISLTLGCEAWQKIDPATISWHPSFPGKCINRNPSPHLLRSLGGGLRCPRRGGELRL